MGKCTSVLTLLGADFSLLLVFHFLGLLLGVPALANEAENNCRKICFQIFIPYCQNCGAVSLSKRFLLSKMFITCIFATVTVNIFLTFACCSSANMRFICSCCCCISKRICSLIRFCSSSICSFNCCCCFNISCWACIIKSRRKRSASSRSGKCILVELKFPRDKRINQLIFTDFTHHNSTSTPTVNLIINQLCLR